MQSIDIGASIGAATLREAQTGAAPPLAMQAEDLHRQLRHQQPRRLVIFAVDTSDSMGDGPEAHMAAALGAATALTAEAYVNRDQVCLVTFRDQQARVLVPPTESPLMVRRHLQKLPVGGATPLAAALEQVLKIVRQARIRDPERQILVVLISDGEATVPLGPSGDPLGDALTMAKRLRREPVSVLLINTNPANASSGIMDRLADLLATSCYRIHQLRAGQVLDLIRQN